MNYRALLRPDEKRQSARAGRSATDRSSSRHAVARLHPPRHLRGRWQGHSLRRAHVQHDPQTGRRSDAGRFCGRTAGVRGVSCRRRLRGRGNPADARARDSARSTTACSPTTANTSSNGVCTTCIAASRFRPRSNFRAGSASGSWRPCTGGSTGPSEETRDGAGPGNRENSNGCAAQFRPGFLSFPGFPARHHPLRCVPFC